MNSWRVVGTVIIILQLHTTTSDVQKSFKFQASPKQESKFSKFKGRIVPSIVKAAKYFTVPPQIDFNASDPDQIALREIPEEVEFDACSTTDKLCLNGGVCKNDRGKFHCTCPESHYGRRCELVADKTACSKHSCENGGICYTTPDAQRVVPRKKVEELHRDMEKFALCRETASAGECEKKNQLQSPTKEDFLAATDTVRYRCQCPLGFQGPLCDYTKKERICEEDFCMGHGYALLKPDGSCKCVCEPEYIGEHCETLLPCSAFQCHNEGICKDIYDPTSQSYAAKCDCVSFKDELIEGSVEVKGDHCEIISFVGLLDSIDMNPCGDKQTYLDSLDAFSQDPGLQVMIEAKLAPGGVPLFTDAPTTLREAVTAFLFKGNSYLESADTMCQNDGDCSLVIDKILIEDPNEKDEAIRQSTSISFLFPLPKCICKPLSIGDLCEDILESVCDLTPRERLEGLKVEERCTSYKNGVCATNINEERVCECNPEFIGDKCETYAPCEARPCGENAECIAIPFEKFSPTEQAYRCICDIADEQNGDDCVYHGEGACAGHNPCNHGRCIACPNVTATNLTSICEEDEAERGFRCLCAPGFAPPLCEKQFGPCESHLCLHGGVCKINDEHTYDCFCPRGTAGDYCETVTDYCEFHGDRMCSNTGNCRNTNISIRGFECECNWDYHGANCEIESGAFRGIYLWFDANYALTYPLVAVFGCIAFLIVIDALFGRDRIMCRTNRRKELSTARPSSSKKDTAVSQAPLVITQSVPEPAQPKAPDPPLGLPQSPSNKQSVPDKGGLKRNGPEPDPVPVTPQSPSNKQQEEGGAEPVTAQSPNKEKPPEKAQNPT